MQTAVGVFGGEANSGETSAPPLMAENVGHSGRPAISSLNSPPFIAVELCRELLVWNFAPFQFSMAFELLVNVGLMIFFFFFCF